MILHASYTGVDGSNCIVFTTLHWRTQIFSDKATILEGIMASPTYTPEKHSLLSLKTLVKPVMIWKGQKGTTRLHRSLIVTIICSERSNHLEMFEDGEKQLSP